MISVQVKASQESHSVTCHRKPSQEELDSKRVFGDSMWVKTGEADREGGRYPNLSFSGPRAFWLLPASWGKLLLFLCEQEVELVFPLTFKGLWEGQARG